MQTSIRNEWMSEEQDVFEYWKWVFNKYETCYWLFAFMYCNYSVDIAVKEPVNVPIKSGRGKGKVSNSLLEANAQSPGFEIVMISLF